MQRRAWVATLALIFGALGAGRANAQVTGSATLETEYRVRGVSWTEGRPDARLSLNYDHSSGLYAGGSVIIGKDPLGDVRALGHVESAGFAKRVGGDLSIDLGALYWQLSAPVRVTLPPSSFYPSGYTYIRSYKPDYTEIYAGLIKGPVSARLHYSPDYLSQGASTLYGDLTAAHAIGAGRVFAHVGALKALDSAIGVGGDRTRFDYRVGAAYGVRFGELQLAWSGSDNAEYPPGHRRSKSGFVLSASAFF